MPIRKKFPDNLYEFDTENSADKALKSGEVYPYTSHYRDKYPVFLDHFKSHSTLPQFQYAFASATADYFGMIDKQLSSNPVKNFFSQSYDHRILRSMVFYTFLKQVNRGTDNVGVALEQIKLYMRCGITKKEAIINNAIEAGYIGRSLSKINKTRKNVYATPILIVDSMIDVRRHWTLAKNTELSKYHKNCTEIDEENLILPKALDLLTMEDKRALNLSDDDIDALNYGNMNE